MEILRVKSPCNIDDGNTADIYLYHIKKLHTVYPMLYKPTLKSSKKNKCYKLYISLLSPLPCRPLTYGLPDFQSRNTKYFAVVAIPAILCHNNHFVIR